MSSSSSHSKPGNIKAMFETVHVTNQNVGELDRFFVAQFFHDLGNQWHFIDDNGVDHYVDFNMSATQPALTNGWSSLRNFYKWVGNKQITFLYCGNNTFRMKQIAKLCFLPSWHSLSDMNPNYPSFIVRLYDTNFSSTELLLPNDLGSFLVKKNHSEVKLSGPLNHVVTCKVINSNGRNATVKFGEGWTSFCQLNDIAEGNQLKFQYDGLMKYNNVLIVTVM